MADGEDGGMDPADVRTVAGGRQPAIRALLTSAIVGQNVATP